MKYAELVLALSVVLSASAFAEEQGKTEQVYIKKISELGLKVNSTSGLSSESVKTGDNKHIYSAVENEGDFAGKAAFFVYDPKAGTNAAANKNVSFAKIDKTANNIMVKAFAKGILGKDANNVTVAQLYRMTGALWSAIPKMPDHSGLGRMSYAQAGNLDVYFGDWADVSSGANADSPGSNYTVFYSGTGKTTNLPTTGSATYAVKGINNHVKQGTAVLTGDLTANFAAKTLNGTMARPGLSIAINNASITSSDASFSGKSTANNSVIGTTNGHFFGDKGAAIAGITEFGKNHTFNTAFGGVKK